MTSYNTNEYWPIIGHLYCMVIFIRYYKPLPFFHEKSYGYYSYIINKYMMKIALIMTSIFMKNT